MVAKNEVIEFLHQSISDTQQTIRAIDVKTGFMFLLLFAPLPIAQQIYDHALTDCHKSVFGLIVVIAAVFTWVLAVIMQFIALAVVIDPGDKVLRPLGATGSFFSGGLFSFNFIEAICGSKALSKRTLDEQVELLPKNDDEIVRELTFERMKLSFILILKATRSRFAILFTAVWFSVSLILCLVDRLI
ncbi:MAG TPA: hypothetical protein DDZ81_00410 [Acetobacteraceae bacterium]|jgi:hypothetical protein|nr:hypothetical protein [Acetobacteraceae bacterium]